MNNVHIKHEGFYIEIYNVRLMFIFNSVFWEILEEREFI
jgi:hypothetical protein